MQTAFKNRNLQLYFSGQVISLVGTWMQQMALSWLLYRLTNSPFMLGLIGFTSQAPSLLLSPFAGLTADRVNRHKLLIATQMLAMVEATVLTVLVWHGQPQLWQLIALSAFMGIITAFDIPTRQSFLVDMLDDKSQMAPAISFNSSINTLTRLIGPFVAGLFVAWAGEKTCFLVNALSYVPVVIALLFVKSHQNTATTQQKQSAPLAALKEGFAYTVSFTPIRDLICLLALLGLFAMPFAVLMPAFAKDVFHGDAMTLGFLTGASGAGSMIGALFLASRKGTKDLSNWIIIGSALCGIGLVGLGFSQLLPLSLVAVALLGFGNMIALAGSNTVIQAIVDEDKRGRVMSFFVMAFLGTAPFGSMAAGALATHVGVGRTVIFMGALTLALALVFNHRIRRIHTLVQPQYIDEEIALVEAEDELAIVH